LGVATALGALPAVLRDGSPCPPAFARESPPGPGAQPGVFDRPRPEAGSISGPTVRPSARPRPLTAAGSPARLNGGLSYGARLVGWPRVSAASQKRAEPRGGGRARGRGPFRACNPRARVEGRCRAAMSSRVGDDGLACQVGENSVSTSRYCPWRNLAGPRAATSARAVIARTVHPCSRAREQLGPGVEPPSTRYRGVRTGWVRSNLIAGLGVRCVRWTGPSSSV